MWGCIRFRFEHLFGLSEHSWVLWKIRTFTIVARLLLWYGFMDAGIVPRVMCFLACSSIILFCTWGRRIPNRHVWAVLVVHHVGTMLVALV
jgi:hypothetical protein